MAECRDFFDDSTTGRHRSSALCRETPSSDIPQGKEDVSSHCLELTLGPSNFSGSTASPLRLQHDMVRPGPAFPFLPRQPSGDFASCLPATSYTSPSPLLQSDGPMVSNGLDGVATALGRQRSGNFTCAVEHPPLPFKSRADAMLPVTALLPEGNTTFPSRDQIWQTLQKSGTLFEATQPSNDASSMWSRRAASMQSVFPRKAGDDLEHCQIRRSCSNGVPTHALSHPISKVESSLDRSPQHSMGSASHPHSEELEDLQKRKEMQAQRRLEARKRRRNLLGEKQHKRGKQNSGLLHAGSRGSISPNNKVSQGGAPSGDDDAAPESHCMSLDVSKFGKLDDSKKVVQELQDGKCDMQVSSIEDNERLSQDIQLDGGQIKAIMHTYGKGSGSAQEKTMSFLSNEHDSGSHGSLTSSELEQPAGPMNKCSVAKRVLGSSSEHECCKPPAVTAMNDHVRMPISEIEGAKFFPGCGTECVENDIAPADVAKREGGMRRASLPSGSAGCPPLLFSPLQYAYATASATPSAISTQPTIPLPYYTQNPVAGNCGNGSTMQNSTTVHGSCPPVTNTFAGTFPLSSGALLARTTSAPKDFIEDSEGKGESSARSAFAPLQRTTSSLKIVFGEPQFSGTHLDLQVSLTASQLSSMSTIVSDASNGKSLHLERQPSRPLGGRLLSQNSGVVDQAFLCSRQEKSVPGQTGGCLLFEAPTLRLGNSSLNQQEGPRQEDASSESQLASEHSGVDASFAQSRVIEKQSSGSFLDFPWVTTTGKGPNGITINGYMYLANGRQVRLVCNCHGKHMSPVEFVEHSGSSDLSNPERSIVVSPFPHINHQVATTPV